MIPLPPFLLPDDTTPRPLPASYWVIPERLLAGPDPTLADPEMQPALVEAMIDCGVRGIFNLMEECETPRTVSSVPSSLADEMSRRFAVQGRSHRHPIPDMGVPTLAGMTALLDALDTALFTTAGALYLHCRGGFGRTGTVVGCWLARHGYARGERALTLLAELRSPASHAHVPSPETEAQRKMVCSWREGH